MVGGVKQNGRPKQTPKLVGMFFNFPEPIAEQIRTAKDRKGMEQNKYLAMLVTMGDKHIPNRQKMVFRFTTRKPAVKA